MRPSSRDRIVQAALRLSVSAPEATLQQLAKAAGLTKQGLLYHFADKRALQLAMLDHITERWESELEGELGAPLHSVTAGQRISAYARVAARGHVVEGEATIFAELAYRVGDLSWYDNWASQWFFTDTGGSPSPALMTAWLAANGLWSTLTLNKVHIGASEVQGIISEIDRLTGGMPR